MPLPQQRQHDQPPQNRKRMTGRTKGLLWQSRNANEPNLNDRSVNGKLNAPRRLARRKRPSSEPRMPPLPPRLSGRNDKRPLPQGCPPHQQSMSLMCMFYQCTKNDTSHLDALLLSLHSQAGLHLQAGHLRRIVVCSMELTAYPLTHTAS